MSHNWGWGLLGFLASSTGQANESTQAARSRSARWVGAVKWERITHTVLTLTMLWIGFVFAFPHDLFAKAMVYSEMKALAPQSVWAVFFGSCGLIGALGYWPGKPKLRLACLTILSTAHLTFAILVDMGDQWPTTAAGTYMILACAGMALVARETVA